MIDVWPNVSAFHEQEDEVRGELPNSQEEQCRACASRDDVDCDCPLSIGVLHPSRAGQTHSGVHHSLDELDCSKDPSANDELRSTSQLEPYFKQSDLRLYMMVI